MLLTKYAGCLVVCLTLATIGTLASNASPWPMQQGDAENSGYAWRVTGPQLPECANTHISDVDSWTCSPVVTADDVIVICGAEYVGQAGAYWHFIYGLDEDSAHRLSVRFKYRTKAAVRACPAITSQNNIVCVDQSGFLYYIDQSGQEIHPPVPAFRYRRDFEDSPAYFGYSQHWWRNRLCVCCPTQTR